jgi:hypothetical protein
VTFAPQDLPSVVLSAASRNAMGFKTGDMVIQVKAQDDQPDAIKWIKDFSTTSEATTRGARRQQHRHLHQARNNSTAGHRPGIAQPWGSPDRLKNYVDDFPWHRSDPDDDQRPETDQQISMLRRVQKDLSSEAAGGMEAELSGELQVTMAPRVAAGNG